MKDAKAEFMLAMEAKIEAITAATLAEMHRARHFTARSAGQRRRRQREYAERTAPNYPLITNERGS